MNLGVIDAYRSCLSECWYDKFTGILDSSSYGALMTQCPFRKLPYYIFKEDLAGWLFIDGQNNIPNPKRKLDLSREANLLYINLRSDIGVLEL